MVGEKVPLSCPGTQDLAQFWSNLANIGRSWPKSGRNLTNSGQHRLDTWAELLDIWDERKQHGRPMCFATSTPKLGILSRSPILRAPRLWGGPHNMLPRHICTRAAPIFIRCRALRVWPNPGRIRPKLGRTGPHFIEIARFRSVQAWSSSRQIRPSSANLADSGPITVDTKHLLTELGGFRTEFGRSRAGFCRSLPNSAQHRSTPV